MSSLVLPPGCSERNCAVDVFTSAISDPNLAEKIAVQVDNEIAMPFRDAWFDLDEIQFSDDKAGRVLWLYLLLRTEEIRKRMKSEISRLW